MKEKNLKDIISIAKVYREYGIPILAVHKEFNSIDTFKEIDQNIIDAVLVDFINRISNSFDLNTQVSIADLYHKHVDIKPNIVKEVFYRSDGTMI